MTESDPNRGALELWRKKLARFREQEAITSDAAQKFALEEQIKDAQLHIQALERESAPQRQEQQSSPASDDGMPCTAPPGSPQAVTESTAYAPNTQPRFQHETVGGAPAGITRTFVSKLPSTGGYFLGRKTEFELLDKAWASKGKTQVVALVAWAGVGKTALVKRWLDQLKAENWRGASRVYAWSFYSRGTHKRREDSDEALLSDALRWFEVEHDSKDSSWHKWHLLADAITHEPTLLILDGIESLQRAPGPSGGQFVTVGLQTLLRQLAASSKPGLCVITTRQTVTDLADHDVTQGNATGSVTTHKLGNLSEHDGARLLHNLGTIRAGAATIEEDDAELRRASREVRCHALTLSLLGRYLALAHHGDILRRDEVKLSSAVAAAEEDHARSVVAAYERWFEASGHSGKQCLAALRLLAVFDHPADDTLLSVLRKKIIHGLNETLLGLDTQEWALILGRLQECGLAYFNQPPEAGAVTSELPLVDTHPLIRDHFHNSLVSSKAAAWRQANARLYRHLRDTSEARPATFESLQPLYRAIAHGCQARLHNQALAQVYAYRILRGTEYYSVFKLGTFGEDLGALACFFEQPWSRVSDVLAKRHHPLLLSQVAFYLRAVGRLVEALVPSRSSLQNAIKKGEWTAAAVRANNLSELELALGDVSKAVKAAQDAVTFADRSADDFFPISTRTTLADALHQAGQRAEARQWFCEAELRQKGRQPHYPRLYSLQGFRYCSLLLTDVERAAWRFVLGDRHAGGESSLRDRCQQIEERARQTMEWEAKMRGAHLIDFGLHQLILWRSKLYSALINPGASEGANAKARSLRDLTLNDLRRGGAQEFIIRGLSHKRLVAFTLRDGEAGVQRLERGMGTRKAWSNATADG